MVTKVRRNKSPLVDFVVDPNFPGNIIDIVLHVPMTDKHLITQLRLLFIEIARDVGTVVIPAHVAQKVPAKSIEGLWSKRLTSGALHIFHDGI